MTTEIVKANWSQANKVLKGNAIWNFSTEVTINKILDLNPGATPLMIQRMLDTYEVEIAIQDGRVTSFTFV
jgi:hypothetical protein